MEKWILLNKAVILLYCCLIYIRGQVHNYVYLLLFILGYISINMTAYIINNNKLRGLLLLSSTILIIPLSIYVNIYFMLLFPTCVFEAASYYTRNIFMPAAASALPITIVNAEYTAEYIVFGVLSFIVFRLCLASHEKISELLLKNDELKHKNYYLSTHNEKNDEYLEQLKYVSQLEERNNIAQEIHDKIGHTISGSLMQLEAARLLMKVDVEKSNSMVENVVNVLREGMESIRSTLRNIKPPAEQMGIGKVKLMIDRFALNNKTKVNFLYEGNLEYISFIQWKVIYENISEALTNSIKYAEADSVTVSIRVLNRIIKAEIKDNGLGELQIKKGLGIRGIEERTQNIGGNVIVDGTSGFSIIMLLPVNIE